MKSILSKGFYNYNIITITGAAGGGAFGGGAFGGGITGGGAGILGAAGGLAGFGGGGNNNNNNRVEHL